MKIPTASSQKTWTWEPDVCVRVFCVFLLSTDFEGIYHTTRTSSIWGWCATFGWNFCRRFSERWPHRPSTIWGVKNQGWWCANHVPELNEEFFLEILKILKILVSSVVKFTSSTCLHLRSLDWGPQSNQLRKLPTSCFDLNVKVLLLYHESLGPALWEDY